MKGTGPRLLEYISKGQDGYKFPIIENRNVRSKRHIKGAVIGSMKNRSKTGTIRKKRLSRYYFNNHVIKYLKNGPYKLS